VAVDFDVLIVGAGISGIGMGCQLTSRRPGTTFAILEARDAIGGTWDLFRFPGIRSDSDLHTFGYEFKPWTSDNAIAGADEILAYLREAVEEHRLGEHIRFGHKVLGADWSSRDARWTVRVQHGDEVDELTCRVLFSATGYYDYAAGHRPHFDGEEDFAGRIVHPQHWPEDLDYAGKRVVVIGSGATAVTLIPALVNSGAGHVTMLQRSPTYIGSLPLIDPVAERANRWLPASAAHVVNRWKAIAFSTAQYQLSRKFPNYMRKTLLTMAKRRLPEGYDVEKHFGPSYNVWDQRLCLAPDGDLFKTIRHDQADVVTDTIDRFTKTGIKLNSGDELQADIIITATGLNLQLFGGAEIRRNGLPVELTDTMAYKGMMLTDMPNMAFTIGYTNASWTLKADLVSEFVCRVLNYMDSHGYDTVVPQHPGDSVDERPLMDFTPGYVLRALDYLPKAGSVPPWRLKQNYLLDLQLIRRGRVDDEALQFARKPAALPV